MFTTALFGNLTAPRLVNSMMINHHFDQLTTALIILRHSLFDFRPYSSREMVLTACMIIGLIIVVLQIVHVECFSNSARKSSITAIALNALDPRAVEILEGMKEKYNQLNNLASPETETEAKTLKTIVNKYNTYLEVKKMMIKLRILYKNEASDQRKAKQLKSFIGLMKGKLEIEAVLTQQVGLPVKPPTAPIELGLVNRLKNEVKLLEEKYENIKIKLPPGQSTGEARFGY
jgi:hypothetical protein